MVYLVGIVITIFLSFILLTKKEKSDADKILFAWLCVIWIHLSTFAIISSKEFLDLPYLLGLELPLPLLHGPFLFIYTSALTSEKRIGRQSLIHLLPFAIGLILILPFLFLSPNEKIGVYLNEGEGYTLLTSFFFAGIIVSGIVYISLSLRQIFRHRKRIKDNFSYTEKVNLQWLLNLTIGLSCIWLIIFFAEDKFIFSAVVVYVLFIGYYGIKQVGIFTNQRPHENAINSVPPDNIGTIKDSLENPKYLKSSLSDEQIKTIHGDLGELMRMKKMFLTPELTLAMVAQELDVHPNTLSQVINLKEEKNFFDYINSLRVAEFKARAVKPENHKYTLLALAFECGFNSKTSFNRNFKNATGESPSMFSKAAKVDLK